LNVKLIISILTFGFIVNMKLCGQTPVEVTESTLKVGIMAEEVFYLGFAEGDKIIFDFEEANGKELKELEIIELPSSSRFLDYKTTRVSNKSIQVSKTGIYKFRFTNSSIGPRICKYKIQRIPASPATQNFNTTVYTHIENDTTYTSEEEEYIAKTDTVIMNYQDRIVKVNTSTVSTGNKATFNFLLPENTIAWSYYLFTNEPGKQAFEKANTDLISNSAVTIQKFPMYTVLSAIALGNTVSIPKLESGEDINYWITDGENAALFTAGSPFRYIRKGKSINDYSRMEKRKGNLFFCFSNDNTTESVTVTVKITSVQVNEALETRQGKRMIITPRNKMYLKN